MYILRTTTVTTHTCFTLLSLLESYNYDTSWLRLIWNSKGITDLWCATRCVEIINQEGYKIPSNLLEHEITYKEINYDRD